MARDIALKLHVYMAWATPDIRSDYVKHMAWDFNYEPSQC
jgi:hypothetical protein